MSLKDYIKNEGWHMAQVARKLGMIPETFRYKCQDPKLSHIKAVAKVIGVNYLNIIKAIKKNDKKVQ